jgi:tocopherol O-methyltransferase
MDVPFAQDRVVEYYRETAVDYRFFLGLDDHLGIHFGYYDTGDLSCDEGIANMNRMLAVRAGIRPGMEVLDAGCGIGGSALWLARQLGARVTGITLLEEQRARASELARIHEVGDRVRFLVGDYARTGLPAGSFDVVWGLESICHAPDKREFLREARRVLRPGGTVIVADGFRHDRPYAPTEEALMRRWLSGWAVPDLDPAGRFASSLAAAGFADVESTDITENVMPYSRWLGQRARILLPFGRLGSWLRLGWPSRVQLDNLAATWFQYQALRRRLWQYVVFKARC